MSTVMGSTKTQTPNIYIVDEDRVRESFETTVQRVDKDVEIIREWLKTQPHLPEIMDRPN
jgi:hypothetical protein